MQPSIFISVINAVVFTTPDLTPGSHNIRVTYLGSNLTTPLALKHLLITNVTTSDFDSNTISTASDVASSSNPTAIAYSNALAAHPRPFSKATLIGTTVGGVTAVILLVTGVVLYWRRRKIRRSRSLVVESVVPSTDDLHMTSISGSISGPADNSYQTGRIPGLYPQNSTMRESQLSPAVRGVVPFLLMEPVSSQGPLSPVRRNVSQPRVTKPQLCLIN